MSSAPKASHAVKSESTEFRSDMGTWGLIGFPQEEVDVDRAQTSPQRFRQSGTLRPETCAANHSGSRQLPCRENCLPWLSHQRRALNMRCGC